MYTTMIPMSLWQAARLRLHLFFAANCAVGHKDKQAATTKASFVFAANCAVGHKEKQALNQKSGLNEVLLKQCLFLVCHWWQYPTYSCIFTCPVQLWPECLWIQRIFQAPWHSIVTRSKVKRLSEKYLVCNIWFN